jgi:iron complex transport system substrate-binding protein
MKRSRLYAAGVLVLGLVVAACAGPGPASSPVPAPQEVSPMPTSPPTSTALPTVEPVVVADARGERIELAGPAERVVSLAPSNTEILYAIGAGDRLVGRDDFSDYPESAMEAPSIGSTYGELNVEAVVGLEPEVVLAAGITPPEQIQALEEVGLPVFVVGNPQEFDGLFENLVTVGVLTGREEQAEALAQDLEGRFREVTSAVADVEPVKLFYEVDGTDPTAPWTTGSGTFQQLVFELAGGENIASDLEGWVQLSEEEIVVRDPEVIIFATGSFVPTTVESLKARAGWGQITAVREGHVYALDTDLLDLPGPRLVEGLERVAEILHPERFNQ